MVMIKRMRGLVFLMVIVHVHGSSIRGKEFINFTICSHFVVTVDQMFSLPNLSLRFTINVRMPFDADRREKRVSK